MNSSRSEDLNAAPKLLNLTPCPIVTYYIILYAPTSDLGFRFFMMAFRFRLRSVFLRAREEGDLELTSLVGTFPPATIFCCIGIYS